MQKLSFTYHTKRDSKTLITTAFILLLVSTLSYTSFSNIYHRNFKTIFWDVLFIISAPICILLWFNLLFSDVVFTIESHELIVKDRVLLFRRTRKFPLLEMKDLAIEVITYKRPGLVTSRTVEALSFLYRNKKIELGKRMRGFDFEPLISAIENAQTALAYS